MTSGIHKMLETLFGNKEKLHSFDPCTFTDEQKEHRIETCESSTAAWCTADTHCIYLILHDPSLLLPKVRTMRESKGE
jgi:hypothetical protein